MNYNPNIHHRSSIRLKNYDYSQEGLYFVTICVQRKQCLLGRINDGKMILNDVGKIATRCLEDIPQHFLYVNLHDYVVMPNHTHVVVEIVGANNHSPNNTNNVIINGNASFGNINNRIRANDYSPLRGTSRTIGSIIRGFKIGVTKYLGYSVWQRNYYEHIIRNEGSYQDIVDYINSNPINWNKDKFHFYGEP